MEIRVVCNVWNWFGITLYEMQCEGKNGWVTVGTSRHLLDFVRKYGQAVLNEYQMIKVIHE